MYHIDTELSLTEITSFQEQKKQVVREIDCHHKTKVPRTIANCKKNTEDRSRHRSFSVPTRWYVIPMACF